MNKDDIILLINKRLINEKNRILTDYHNSKNKIGFCIVDDLLPLDIAQNLYKKFPKSNNMINLSSLRENKYVSANMDKHDSLLENVIYAFQDSNILNFFEELCDIKKLYPDISLARGGVSLMGKGHFLNPHIDNSHDIKKDKWRVLNLLYYISPDWKENFGGNLEIWPNGLKKKQITIHSKFNRLVIMATHKKSWHSVSPITTDKNRACISNYYYSDNPLITSEDSFHVTSFRGRPNQKIRNSILKIDASLRQLLRKIKSY